MSVRRSATSALAALVLGLSAAATAGSATAGPSQALSPWDAQLYSAAFDALKRGDYAGAEAKLAQVKDRCLVGMVEFEKLMQTPGYKASFEELTQWLDKYGDLPVANRVWALAKKRKPDGAPDPLPPMTQAEARTWASVQAASFQPDMDVGGSALSVDPLDPKAARLALNAGDLTTAHALGETQGDFWTAALAAYRQKNYPEAFQHFQQVALDISADPWVRAAGGYWAARAAIAKGSPELAPQFLELASQFPQTFYGQIAERQLGVTPVLRRGGQGYQPSRATLVRASVGDELNSPAMRRFIQSEPRAKRALALAEIGQKIDAGIELKAGIADAKTDEARQDWTRLALSIHAMTLGGRATQAVDEHDYPMPDLQPAGGFTIDRALVWSLIRQETRFNPGAISPAGAYGLMQLMPATAAELEHDDRLRREPSRLFDPAVNMRAGQDYFAYLLSMGPINGDMLRAVEAYNGGPAPVFATAKQLGPETDILLFIESVGVPESRDYVQRVMASYWIYKRLLGEEPKSLDAVAAGTRYVSMTLDRPPALYLAAGSAMSGVTAAGSVPPAPTPSALAAAGLTPGKR